MWVLSGDYKVSDGGRFPVFDLDFLARRLTRTFRDQDIIEGKKDCSVLGGAEKTKMYSIAKNGLENLNTPCFMDGVDKEPTDRERYRCEIPNLPRINVFSA